MRALILRFLRDQSGVTAVEYGLLVACICVALIQGMSMFSSSFNGAMFAIVNALGGP
jgi:pilus assembly protein Flp/PilA